LFSWNKILGRPVNFHAIASAEQQHFIATTIAQDATGLGVPGKIFACFDVRVVIAETDAEQIHGVFVCTLNVIPQRSVSAALNATMQSVATRFGANQRK
jgi:hypothetical protein